MKLNLNITFKFLFIISLLWILTEGIFRKWFFLEYSTPLFFVKYILFGLVYIVFFLQNRIPFSKKKYQIMILIYIIWCLFSITNQRLSPQIYVSLMGVIMHVFFIPIIQLPSITFNSIKTINKFIKYLTYLSIPIGILGIMQYYLPEDDILNSFVRETQKTTKVGIYIRISSIFTFVKIYSVYLVFTITILTAFIYNQLSQKKPLLIYIITYFLLLINLVMTGSRLPIGAVLLNIAVINIYIFLNYSFLKKSVLVILIATGIALFISYNTFDSISVPIDSFTHRTSLVETRAEGSSSEARIIDRINLFKHSDIAGLWGYGIGTTYQAFDRFLMGSIPVYFEEEGERIVLEIGIIGGIIVLLLRFFILFYSYHLFKKVKHPQLKLLSFSFFLIILPSCLMLNDVFFNYLENFVFWISFGFVITISKIDYKLTSKKTPHKPLNVG